MVKQEERTKDAIQQEKKGRAGRIISSFVKLDTKKKIQYVAILLVAIVILTIYFSSFKKGSDSPTPTLTATDTSQPAQNNNVEAELEETLSKIEGAGKVQVMITYESSSEIVPAYSVDKQTSSTIDTGDNGNSTINTENTQSEVVTVNGSNGNSALVLREDSPKIKGVIVVAEGADDIAVKMNLFRAVETVLNVSPDKVDVYKMNIE